MGGSDLAKTVLVSLPDQIYIVACDQRMLEAST